MLKLNSGKRLARIGCQLSRRMSTEVPRGQFLSNPFEIDNIQVIRETKDHFPKPSLISFDVFGTLYEPSPAISHQYHKIASEEFGIIKPVAEIEKEFPVLFKELEELYPNYGRFNDEIQGSDHWWSELIVRLYNIESYKTNKHSAALCNRLLNHFTGPSAYKLYDDVIPTLTKLKNNGINMVISTNSDGRVRDIIHNLGLAQFFPNDNFYLSYDIGAVKPSRQFFDSVSSQFYMNNYHKRLLRKNQGAFLENCWHVGDSHSKDFLGAIRSGWNGVLVDRDQTSEFFSTRTKKPEKEEYAGCGLSGMPGKNKPTDMLMLANNRVVLTRLEQLLEMFNIE
ncbi:hypothetical protein G9P44_000458 [Scheffersomyces stipitis]|nr:hypothetical protein G9P44_000458 [Scheffersomyces stipitis]